MHELPPDADEVLAHARRAQSEPDAAVRDRVRRGVAGALLVGAGVGATTTAAARVGASSGWSSALAAKVVAAAAVCAVALGVTLASRVEQTPGKATSSAAHAVAPSGVGPSGAATQRFAEPAVAAAPAPLQRAPVLEGATKVTPHAEVTPDHPARKLEIPANVRHAPKADAPASLLVELGLLEQAEGALERGDPELALEVLARHRKAFVHSRFIDERDGLTMIARCTLDRTASARDARRFLARARRSVLHERVAATCLGAP